MDWVGWRSEEDAAAQRKGLHKVSKHLGSSDQAGSADDDDEHDLASIELQVLFCLVVAAAWHFIMIAAYVCQKSK